MISCKKIYIGLLSFYAFCPLYAFSVSVDFHSGKFFDIEKSRQVTITKYNAKQLESFQEFSGEIPDGIYESWWRNGEKKYKAFFLKGKENGEVYSWYKNGNKQFTGSMKDGVLEGELTSWFENGNKRTRENYVYGKRNGIWISWYENQKHSSTLTFNLGRIIKCSSWNSEGKMIYTGSERKKCENIFNSNYTMSMESEDPE
ncbi:toxin-antitoxin system YwqK family antitoxin [Enterobacter ludwigii]